MNPSDSKKNTWASPKVQKFGQKKGAAKLTDTQSTTPGDSVIRYGSDCGIRQAQGCRPQNGEACTPLQFGADCRISSGTSCRDRQGYPCTDSIGTTDPTTP